MNFLLNRKIVFSFLLFVIIVKSAWGATYYVKDGGNDNNDGLSDAAAWATISKVESTVSSGDIVYFRSQDMWTDATPPTLTATAGVTYDGSTYGSGSRARLTTTGDYASNPQGVVNIYAGDVTFKGFDVDANLQRLGGIYIGYMITQNISNVTVDDCVVHNTGGISSDWNYGIHIGSKTSLTVSNTTVTNSKIHDTFHEGIAIYPSWTTTGNRVDGVSIRGCTIYNTGTQEESDLGDGTGIAIVNDADNVTVEFNHIHNNNGYGIMQRVSPPWEDDAEPGSSVLSGANNLVIRYNIINDNIIFGYTVSNYRDYSISTSIYGNIFYQNGQANSSNSAAELFIRSDPNWTYPDSVFNIYNNTFYNTKNPAANVNLQTILGVGVWGGGSLGGATVNFKNNILYSGNFIPILDNNNQLTHSNNLVFRSSGALDHHVLSDGSYYDRGEVLTWEPSAKNEDPAFVGGILPNGFTGTFGIDMVPDTNYFAIIAGEALDNGATLEAPYVDAINRAGRAIPFERPQGSYDIGAYEYIITPNPPENFQVLP